MRLGAVNFPDLSAFVGTGGMEIAQGRKSQPVGVIVSFQRVFHEKLRHSVRIDGLARSVFRDRHLCRRSVYRAGGGKHEFLDAGIQRGVQKRQCALHVVSKILPGIGGRLADVGVRSEVHHCLDAAQFAAKKNEFGDIPPRVQSLLRETRGRLKDCHK